jgi:hypothetical protein
MLPKIYDSQTNFHVRRRGGAFGNTDLRADVISKQILKCYIISITDNIVSDTPK